MSLPDKKFLTYEEFLLEKEKLTKDFTPFPMLVKKVGFEDVENPLGKLIGKTRNYLFTQTPVTNSNVDKLEFPKDVPILNYTEHNHLVQKLGIPAKNLYNKPDQSDLVSDKVVFHKTFAKSKHVPETVFSKEDALKLKFPVVAKPAKGKSARGIQKFDTAEELKASKSKFDVFCEAIDLKREFRCFCFKDEIMVLNERLKIKGAKDFLKDKDTKTEFFYKDLSLKSYKKLNELEALVKECRKKVKLDVYSIDFAEDADGKLWIIEMNSRTGMGVDKMIEVYKYIYRDFYGEDIPKELQKSINDLSKEWNKAYKEIKGDNAVNESKSLNECTTVMGEKEGKNFLFKNRDRSFTPENKVIREIKNGTEVVYYSDESGWVEGMNEYGVGAVNSLLTTQDPKYTRFGPAFTVTDDPKSDDPSKYGPVVLNALSKAKTAKELLGMLEKSPALIGSFLIADKNEFYELEIGGKKPVSRKISFPIESRDYYVKTNNAALNDEIGHHDVPYSAKWGISNIRKHQAETLIMGFKEFEEIFDRMKHQTFDTNSPLNQFRTDDEEHTISQCLFQLSDLKFEFHSDRKTANSLEFDDRLPKGKTPKITVKCKEFK